MHLLIDARACATAAAAAFRFCNGSRDAAGQILRGYNNIALIKYKRVSIKCRNDTDNAILFTHSPQKIFVILNLQLSKIK